MKTHSVRRIATAGALLVLAILASLTGARFGAQPARAALGAPDLSMAIDLNGGTDECDTKASTGSIGTTCNVSVGSMFTMRGSIDKVAGLPNTGGYIVFQFQFLYTSPGLTRNNRTGSGEVGPDTVPGGMTFWGPDIPCSPNGEVDGAGSYYVDCWGPGTKSMYVGKLVEVDFTCATVGTRTITMQDAGTYVHNDMHGSTPPDVDVDEVLTINCLAAVGGIAHLPNVAGTAALAAEDSSASWSAWLFALAALWAGVAVVAGAVWRLRSRRID